MDKNSTAFIPKFQPESVTTIGTICLGILLVLSTFSPSSSHAADGAAATPDPERGKQLFSKRCGGCHSLDADKEGPRLGGVYGRKAGSISTFKYSDALKASSIVWNDALLDRWLTDTDSVVPDNDMDFHVPNAQERADIIRFLKVSSGK
jgi:cytochrome c